MALPRPAFVTIWSKFTYIYGDGTLDNVGRIIGGKVKENIDLGKKDPLAGFTNACAIRMSYSLNYSGALIGKGIWKTVSGADKRQYIYRVNDLVKFVRARLGEPDLTVKNPTPADFSGKKGILVFAVSGWSDATGHATLWDGAVCSDKCYFPKANEASIWLLD